MKNEYTYQELSQINQDISNFITMHEDLDSKLVFKLRKNMRIIKEAKEIIEEDFKTADEEQIEKLDEFQDRRLKLVKDNGGIIKPLNNGNVEITNADELNADPEFIEKLEELKNEYQEVIETVEQYDKENYKTSREKVAEVEFTMIPLELFPDRINDSFKETFLDFVTDQ